MFEKHTSELTQSCNTCFNTKIGFLHGPILVKLSYDRGLYFISLSKMDLKLKADRNFSKIVMMIYVEQNLN